MSRLQQVSNRVDKLTSSPAAPRLSDSLDTAITADDARDIAALQKWLDTREVPRAENDAPWGETPAPLRLSARVLRLWRNTAAAEYQRGVESAHTDTEQTKREAVLACAAWIAEEMDETLAFRMARATVPEITATDVKDAWFAAYVREDDDDYGGACYGRPGCGCP